MYRHPENITGLFSLDPDRFVCDRNKVIDHKAALPGGNIPVLSVAERMLAMLVPFS